jgi:hypothetical protein
MTWTYSIWFPVDMDKRLHGKNGRVVRSAPNELSFATKEGWQDSE